MLTAMGKATRVMDSAAATEVPRISLTWHGRILEFQAWGSSYLPFLAPRMLGAAHFPIDHRLVTIKKRRANSVGDFCQRILSATRASIDLCPWSLIVGVTEVVRSGMICCRFRALYQGLPVLQRTDAWFLGERVLWQSASMVPVDPPIRMLRPNLLSTEDRAQAILGYPAKQLVLPDASYPTFNESRLTPFPAFVPRVELRGWVQPAVEITYTDVVRSVIREILPASEDEERISFVLETVE
ncbi:uncharacterized protein LOC110728712 [Chenopodium quinoa]|uniref:uncharacterized protein LOC110728712 n=1 Tax=Chenopodium quinoa TaxID=63459 RepID=UPI000B770121|nr:uncharacterized protein LOC110728712 [Chenopodium quinoa]XP_021764047.1 uncharacterized protein LOC110728712 [Chenopodium quinoa]